MSLIIFWSLVLLVAVPLAVLRDVYDGGAHDTVNRLNGHEPPRSHPSDEFSHTGSSWH